MTFIQLAILVTSINIVVLFTCLMLANKAITKQRKRYERKIGDLLGDKSVLELRLKLAQREAQRQKEKEQHGD